MKYLAADVEQGLCDLPLFSCADILVELCHLEKLNMIWDLTQIDLVNQT